VTQLKPAAGTMAERTLAIDFDGVICDSTEECAVVTWNALRIRDLDATGEQLTSGVPAEFRTRFARVRNYARSLGHFAVALAPAADEITSQIDFDRIYRAIPPDQVHAFVAGGRRVRALLRGQQVQAWCRMHRIFPGIPRLLAQFTGRAHVVTARDAASTCHVLAAHGLDLHIASVIGDCSDKAIAIGRLCARLAIAPERTVFLDDNLTSVLAVAATGATALWARWGWHTVEHEIRARAAGVTAADRPAEVGQAQRQLGEPVAGFCRRCEFRRSSGRNCSCPVRLDSRGGDASRCSNC